MFHHKAHNKEPLYKYENILFKWSLRCVSGSVQWCQVCFSSSCGSYLFTTKCHQIQSFNKCLKNHHSWSRQRLELQSCCTLNNLCVICFWFSPLMTCRRRLCLVVYFCFRVVRPAVPLLDRVWTAPLEPISSSVSKMVAGDFHQINRRRFYGYNEDLNICLRSSGAPMFFWGDSEVTVLH